MQAFEYFPGGNTPMGFYNYYEYILPPKDAKRRIFLKGGPGTGKSTLMRRVANRLQNYGHVVHLLHCSSDPDSLDAIVAPTLGFSMVDGTAPHVCDPVFPGATDEIINLGQFWDRESISKSKERIIAVSHEISNAFSSAYDYLAAAANVQRHQTKIALMHSDCEGIRKKLNALIADLNLQPHIGRPGKIRKGFLSGITPKGIVNYVNSFAEASAKTVCIKSDTDSSSLFLNPLASLLMQSGKDLYLFYCPMQPDSKIEHIFLPKENLFFTTGNAYHTPFRDCAEIDLNEFVASYIEKQADHELIDLLLRHSVNCIKKAKALHDELEQFYVPHMNFDKIHLLSESIVNSLL